MDFISSLLTKFCGQIHYKPLSEIGSFFGGLSGKTKEDFHTGNARYVTYKNVYENPSVDFSITDTVRIEENEKQKSLKYGDIIFTGSSETLDECGLSSVVTSELSEKIYLNSFCFFFRLNDNSILLPDFSKHLFRSPKIRKQIIKTANGVTRFNVSKKLMGNVVIPIPPLEIQNEIVKILDVFKNMERKISDEVWV